jgi:hypothetical protein
MKPKTSLIQANKDTITINHKGKYSNGECEVQVGQRECEGMITARTVRKGALDGDDRSKDGASVKGG